MSDGVALLLSESTLPFQVPPYDRIAVDDYLPAFEAAFAEHRAEVNAITRVRSMPTFENTLIALERSGSALRRVANTFYTVSSADSTPEIQAVEEKLAPLMAAHLDAITLDTFLYQRVRSLWERRAELGLTGEDAYLLRRTYQRMTHAGAGLDDEAKARLTALNQRLSTLTTTFEKNLLADTNDLAVHFTDRSEVDGLSETELAAARHAAAERGEEGWLLPLLNFTNQPVLARLTNADSRRRVLAAVRSRGRRENANDNRPVVLEIVRLRAERARLLGYDSHAAYVTADETAGSPDAVIDLLTRLAAPAVANARAEAESLQAMLDGLEARPLEASDWAFLTERVRAERYAVDTDALKPWFEAERVLQDGVFRAASALYGVTFAERDDLPTYHEGVRVFEVTDADGSAVGLYVLDLYTRDTKRGGAWMNPIVEQSALEGTLPVVVNNLNVTRPIEGPTLLSLDEVNTLFHEFGHALHGLFARTTYPSFSGTNVYRDFVEFPSQVNEMWVMWPEVLAEYAVHHATGEPLDPAIVARLREAEAFNQGFLTTEYLAAAWLDFAWHSLTVEEAAAVTDVDAFQTEALARLGLDIDVVPPRYSTTFFAHVFAGGYSAGYYSYIWSEVLDADTVEWFTDNGGLTRENGDRFRQRLLGVGGSKDPLEAYRDFRGRDADIAPLLARRGLTG
ncbi:M3 family metallopeptidase [Microbacterium gorillae]|uniref:M3 family metallopeptidase n=1 Tax=Microbacterium gorillae TaxID=1231063 RepID=UPI000694252A|nr:M3 family metallopeptidase [Microbacterium gorillae]